jgi:hypothetical protein
MKLSVLWVLVALVTAGCASGAETGSGGSTESNDTVADGGNLGAAGSSSPDGSVDGIGSGQVENKDAGSGSAGTGGDAAGTGGDDKPGDDKDGGGSGGDSGSAGTSGGTAGTSGGAAGTSGGTAGTSGGTAGTSGGTAGTSGGTAGTSGGTAGTSGGTAGTSGGTAGTSGGTAGTSGGTAGTSGGTPTRQEFCSGAGPVVKVPTASGPVGVCTGTIARELFTNAICTCEDTSFAGYLVTRSFSGAQASTPVAQGAPVGVNGQLLAGSYVNAGGTTRVQGTTSFGGYLQVAGDLELKQDVTLLGLLTVGRDAWFENNAVVTAAEVGRNVYTQTGKIAPLLLSGTLMPPSTFDLKPPCPCEPEQILDIDAIVDDGQLHNDNADPSVNLDPASLTDIIGYKEVTLPCGRFYVEEITGIGDLKLKVDGRTALYVGGDVGVTGFLDVELGPNGQLDLFVRGNMVQIGYGKFGDQNRPSNVRVYVGGEDDILYVGYQPFGGNLYAPRAKLYSAGYIDVRGSVFTRELVSGAYINVDYDRDILELGGEDECQPPPPPPPDNEDPDAGTPPPECTDVCMSGCGSGSTCVAGMCTTCTSDADCCSPLVCNEDGTCGPLLY